MQVRLLTRWGSYLQGSTVSVSDARAMALVEAGIARFLPGEGPKAAPVEEKPEEPDEGQGPTLKEIKAKLDKLGVTYHPNIGLEKAKVRLSEAEAATE